MPEIKSGGISHRTGIATADAIAGASVTRLKLSVRGAVQGVGFRPFVFRLAHELKLTGRVHNSPQGVFVEAEGPRAGLEEFLLRIEAERPPRSSIQSLESSWLDPAGYTRFEIRESEVAGEKSALVLPDIATCPDCLREIFDPRDRRHLYPFTNCTHCGPRFTLVESLPYDRANTTMKQFTMCPQCRAEYDDPRDRRFHAQPNACPVCGPRLELWERGNAPPPSHRPPAHAPLKTDALLAAVEAIRAGKIVAVKGLGGFHLMADARSEKAVQRLRERKHREEKPFALMFPSLEGAKAVCAVSPLEARLLRSPEAPIVLLKKLAIGKSPIVDSVAPANPHLGVMLPSNPLHHLLMAELGFPVVATSGNLSDEPICLDEVEALERLGAVADLFLVHNRRIVRQADDSIVRVILDREMVLRRARGYAPLPVPSRIADYRARTARAGGIEFQTGTGDGKSETILAVGAHLKNTVALKVGGQVFLSQHIGDLATEPANSAFRRTIADLERLYEAPLQVVAADLHPDYLSTKFANEIEGGAGRPPTAAAGSPRVAGPVKFDVQHHVAHVLSCMAENEISPPVLGVAWDGTGYGTDGTIWGGEFFLVTDEHVERVAHLRPFRLPGGDKAVREPRRAAIGLLHEMFGDAAFEKQPLPPFQGLGVTELCAFKGMLQRHLNSPLTSSAGRLFDAVASLLGLRQTLGFEGQAAMELEFALEGIETDEAYEWPVAKGAARNETAESKKQKTEMILDWELMIESILADAKGGLAIGNISAKFHNALAEAMVTLARRFGLNRVVLSGGCFQNRYLTERAVRRLREEKFRPYWHQRVPPNDGGIALGQVIAALRARPEIANRKS
ncbi:MAG: carbamoyltransferase HypF [Verrucomicrobiota bacterium]|nr:carbamoyltransferase HypF [Verrucomicrobiota bacterium]